jgi:hypothetical protein
MPNWVKWSAILAVVLLIGVLAATLTRETEPSYQGRTLSEWLLAYGPAGSGTAPKKEAEAAIRQIGTYALPCLLEWICYETPKTGIRPAVANLLRLMPQALRIHVLMNWANDERRLSRADGALWGFGVLRDEARPAIPELARLLTDPRSTNATRKVIFALAFIGKEAIPVFSDYLANTNSPHRLDVVHACQGVALYASDMVPPLVQWLGHVDPKIRVESAHALRFLASHNRTPDLVIQGLTDCLRTNTDPRFRVVSMEALGQYGHDAVAAVPLLMEMIGQPDLQVRAAAAKALSEIAPEALTNAPPQ